MSTRALGLFFVFFLYAGGACAADAQAGKAYFRLVCTQCHTAEATDGGGETGPTLFNLYGAKAGTGDEAFPYSQALKDSQFIWDASILDRFLANPPGAVPGTKMPQPVPEKKDRDDLIAYFQSLASPANK